MIEENKEAKEKEWERKVDGKDPGLTFFQVRTQGEEIVHLPGTKP